METRQGLWSPRLPQAACTEEVCLGFPPMVAEELFTEGGLVVGLSRHGYLITVEAGPLLSELGAGLAAACEEQINCRVPPRYHAQSSSDRQSWQGVQLCHGI